MVHNDYMIQFNIIRWSLLRQLSLEAAFPSFLVNFSQSHVSEWKRS